MDKDKDNKIDQPKNIEWENIKYGEFFDPVKFGKELKETFHVTNVRFLHQSQFGSIYIGYYGKKEEKWQEDCVKNGRKKYVLKVYQHDWHTPRQNYFSCAEKELHYYDLLEHSQICKNYNHLILSTPEYPRGCYVLKLEYLDMSLHDMFKKGIIASMSIAQVRRVMKHVGSALKYMHSLGVVHHEIDLKNIRVKQIDQSDLDKSLLSCEYKVANFFYTEQYYTGKNCEKVKREEARQEKFLRQVITMFLAPEKTARPLLPYNPFLAEVYSYGVIILACLLGPERCENDFESDNGLFKRILLYKEESILDTNLENLLIRILDKDPKERFYMDMVKTFYKPKK